MLVTGKILVLAALGVAGVAYVYANGSGTLQLGTRQLTSSGPIMAAAVSFVAFQGWQLLFYDQENIEDHATVIHKAVYTAIAAAVGIYVLVAVSTFNLAPTALQRTPHTALVDAANTVLSPFGFAAAGGIVIALSALFSTGSAINATLFSAGHFAKGMLSKDLLPDRIGDADADGVPETTILALGAITAAFAVWGSLEAITSFASLAFILIFGSTSLLAFRRRRDAQGSAVPSLVGTVGAFGFFSLMFYHLWRAERETFFMVLVIAVLVLSVELLYFERTRFADEIEEFGDTVDDLVN